MFWMKYENYILITGKQSLIHRQDLCLMEKDAWQMIISENKGDLREKIVLSNHSMTL